MTIAELESLAAHALLSHRYWLQCARNGGNGRYPPAYCIEGAGVWRRRFGQLREQIRARRRRRNQPTEAQRRAGAALARAAARLSS